MHALEPTLTRHGYNVKALSELLYIRQPEVRAFLYGQLPPGRTEELHNQLLAAGIPLGDSISSDNSHRSTGGVDDLNLLLFEVKCYSHIMRAQADVLKLFSRNSSLFSDNPSAPALMFSYNSSQHEAMFSSRARFILKPLLFMPQHGMTPIAPGTPPTLKIRDKTRPVAQPGASTSSDHRPHVQFSMQSPRNRLA
jgi:hypothetical protein